MLMEQSYQLRRGVDGHGELTLFEQNQMTAEERAWWAKRIKSDREELRKQADSIKRK